MSSSRQGGSVGVVGAVGELGGMQLIATASNTQYRGVFNYNANSAALSGTLSAYGANGAFVSSGPFSGTVSPRSQITGTYNLANGDSGSVSLSYDPQYTMPEPLATVAGSYRWTSTRNGGASTLTFGQNGELSGTTETGCSFTGSASVANASYDLLYMSLTYASGTACGTAAGTTLSGLAYYSPASGSAGSLTSAVTSDTTGSFAFYRK